MAPNQNVIAAQPASRQRKTVVRYEAVEKIRVRHEANVVRAKRKADAKAKTQAKVKAQAKEAQDEAHAEEAPVEEAPAEEAPAEEAPAKEAQPEVAEPEEVQPEEAQPEEAQPEAKDPVQAQAEADARALALAEIHAQIDADDEGDIIAHTYATVPTEFLVKHESGHMHWVSEVGMAECLIPSLRWYQGYVAGILWTGRSEVRKILSHRRDPFHDEILFKVNYNYPYHNKIWVAEIEESKMTQTPLFLEYKTMNNLE